jgi:hypothetical protein
LGGRNLNKEKKACFGCFLLSFCGRSDMKRTKNKDASYTIEELFKRSSQQSSQIRRDQQDDQENNDDLLLALQLSKQEQVNEQRRLLEQFSQMSQQTIVASTVTKKKKRLIQPPLREEEEEEEDDDDQWFQTVSVRPQPVHKILKQKKKRAENKKKDPSKSTLKQAKDIVKTEKDSNEIVLDIDDMSEWLEAKEEPKVEDNFVIEDMSEWLKAKEEPEVEDNLVIDDLSAFLNQDDATSASILIDDEEKVLLCFFLRNVS